MMMQGLKLASLFLAYGTVGAVGDLVVEAMIAKPAAPQVLAIQEAGWVGEGCEYRAEQRLSLEASSADLLQLDAGSGMLRVEGREGLDEVRVVAELCASSEDLLDGLQVTLDRRSGDVVIVTHYPDRRSRWDGDQTARIDLVVEIPKGMPAELDDSSGGMEVSGTGNLRIHDSSGSLYVSDVAGGLYVDDSSGEIVIRNVDGDVEVDDGSGEIDIRDVTGSVRLDDGSGSIDVEGAGRDVVVERDGSGSIDVRDVGGDFSVLRDGSGGIRHSGVQGSVDIPRDKRRGN